MILAPSLAPVSHYSTSISGCTILTVHSLPSFSAVLCSNWHCKTLSHQFSRKCQQKNETKQNPSLFLFFQKHNGDSKVVSHSSFKNRGLQSSVWTEPHRAGPCPSMWERHHASQLTPLWADDWENALRMVAQWDSKSCIDYCHLDAVYM